MDTYEDTMSQVSIRSPNYNEEIKDRSPSNNHLREIESMHKVQPNFSNWKSDKFFKAQSSYPTKP